MQHITATLTIRTSRAGWSLINAANWLLAEEDELPVDTTMDAVAALTLHSRALEHLPGFRHNTGPSGIYPQTLTIGGGQGEAPFQARDDIDFAALAAHATGLVDLHDPATGKVDRHALSLGTDHPVEATPYTPASPDGIRDFLAAALAFYTPRMIHVLLDTAALAHPLSAAATVDPDGGA